MAANSIKRVINLFRRLPGVGEKSAKRFAYFYLYAPTHEARALARALEDMVTNTVVCEKCFNRVDKSPCDICYNGKRQQNLLCVVGHPLDVEIIEDTKAYNGLYFVLGGIIDPSRGVYPEELRFSELKKRIIEIGKTQKEIELILAFSTSLESDATIFYIRDMIKKINGVKIKLSRLAQGLPLGTDLDIVDKTTLKSALNRRSLI